MVRNVPKAFVERLKTLVVVIPRNLQVNEQVVGSAVVNKITVRHDKDTVKEADVRKLVRRAQNRLSRAGTGHPLQVGHERGFCGAIKSRRRFVEQKD